MNFTTIFFILTLMASVASFSTSPSLALRSNGLVKSYYSPKMHIALEPRGSKRTHTRLFAVDPSSIDIDPIVVSGAFWATLRSKIISSIIGNLIGGVVIAVGGGLVGAALTEFKSKGNKDADGEGGERKSNELVQNMQSKAEGLKDSVKEKVKDKVKDVNMPSFDDIPKPSLANNSLFTVPSALALVVSVVLDLLGDASYSLPFLGDASDVIFAPIAGLVLYKLYGSNIITVLGIVEELLPGADFIPTGSIAWYFKYVVSKDSKMRDFFGFGDGEGGGQNDYDGNVIDVDARVKASKKKKEEAD